MHAYKVSLIAFFFLFFTELIEKQNNFVVGVLAEHTVLLEQVTNKEKGTAAAASRFPLKTDEDISKLEGEINETNRDSYVIVFIQYNF